MAIPGGPTSLPVDQALYLNAMNKPVWDSLVWKASMGYGVLRQLTARMNTAAGGSQRVGDYIFYNAKLDDRGIFSSITAAPTLAGGNLTIPIAGDPYQFRIRDVVQDANYKQARVVGRTINGIIVESIGSATLSASVDFQANTQVAVLFDASGNRCSEGKENLNYVPESDYGYIATTRDSSHQCKREQIDSFVKYRNGFWHTGWDDLTVQHYENQMEDQLYWSERSIKYQGTANEVRTTGGLRWSIMNNGGLYEALTSPLTQTTLNAFLNEMMIKSTQANRKTIMLVGQYALSSLTGIIDPYIKEAGIHNTFGGAGIKGLNVNSYGYGGMNADFSILPLFNNYKKRPEISTITGNNKLANSILFLDVAPLETYSAGMRPTIQKKHFGAKETYMMYKNGIGTDFTVNDIATGNTETIISDVMGREFHIAGENGYYITAQNMGLIELAY